VQVSQIFLVFFMTLVLGACSGQKIENYRDKRPLFEPKSFFNGHLEAKGVVTNRSGEVIQRFTCKIIGSWEGNKGQLDEIFSYTNKNSENPIKRLWKLELMPEEHMLKGSAGDIVGEARGKFMGNSFNFHYTLRVPIDGKTYDISVNDWMYLIDENTLMAKSDMSKWGFDVGQVKRNENSWGNFFSF